MKTSSHLDKFERLRALRARLDPLEDFELWWWTTLTAGTNALYASRRLASLTESKAAGRWNIGERSVRPVSESKDSAGIDHEAWPNTESPPQDILSLERALQTIDRHRDPCFHGGREPTRAIVAECEAAFALVCRVLRSRCDWSLV